MGLGDVKMLAMIGAFLGWRQVWVVLFLASLAGAVIGGALAAFRARSLQSRLPFGTFLALAAFVAMLVGEDLDRLVPRALLEADCYGRVQPCAICTFTPEDPAHRPVSGSKNCRPADASRARLGLLTHEFPSI